MNHWPCAKLYLPQMKLVLVGLRYGGERMEMTEELDPVVRLDVMETIAEHLE